jgi:hypothetical protein
MVCIYNSLLIHVALDLCRGQHLGLCVESLNLDLYLAHHERIHVSLKLMLIYVLLFV